MTRLLLIHTGGTIGMGATDKGYAPIAGVVEHALHDLNEHRVDVLNLDPLIDSAHATPQDWNRIAAAIEGAHDRYAGFVVTHGTDTLAFTAAALTFALAGVGKPVVVTGAMLPIIVDGSDGPRNLQDAVNAAFRGKAGVWVQFGGRLIHGARARKTHSSAFDAFEGAAEAALPRIDRADLRRVNYGTPELAILSMAPGVSSKVIASVLSACDGVVLRVFGSGTVPESAALRKGLFEAQARGTPVIAVSQCPEGRLAFGTYAAGSVLIEAGVVDGRDMTVEAAYAKLGHVLAQDIDPITRKALLGTILCGEASREP